MKNIHVIPTSQPSRLAYYQESTSYNKPILQIVKFGSSDYKYQNIYITSDEEIKEGDFWLYICPINGLDYGDNGNPIVKNNLPNSWFEKLHDKNNYKKIILSTDQDLIKDGVQAIDDGFLEWFVKNSSCEEVEVEFDYNSYKLGKVKYRCYKIIIPKEEIKQLTDLEIAIKLEEIQRAESEKETLEEIFKETASKYAEEENSSYTNDYYGFINGAIEGVKWQKEQDKNKYSEEEVIELLNKREDCINQTSSIFEYTTAKDWFEQFKKK